MSPPLRGKRSDGQMAAIRRFYSVPARRGGRVLYTYNGILRTATILSADRSSMHLWLRFDDAPEDRAGPFHPTWEITYLGADDA